MNDESTPATIKEVGIHIAYIRADMKLMKHAIESMPNGFATKNDVITIEKELTDFKADIKSKINTMKYVTPVIYIFLTAVITGLVSDYLHRRGI